MRPPSRFRSFWSSYWINGYRIVHLQPKEPVRTLADYDALVARELKGSVADARPTANVVRTITRRAD